MGAIIGAIAGIAGDLISSSGQSAANAQSADQAAANRLFQAQQQQQVEDWETNMSDTAMQRRVADLKAAGLNPLLAISQGGASQPSVSPATGSMPSFGNPDSAFGNLGSQVTSAMQTEATIKQQNAQADLATQQANLVHSQTPTSGGVDDQGNVTISNRNNKLGDAQVANIQAQTGTTIAQAQQTKANVDYINAQTNTQNILTLLQGQNLQVLQATKTALIQQELAKGAEAANVQSVASGKIGIALQYINSILKPVSSAAGAAGHFVP